jgi:two-component system cell cycle sensor histidine kinase/response regulator CckA
LTEVGCGIYVSEPPSPATGGIVKDDSETLEERLRELEAENRQLRERNAWELQQLEELLERLRLSEERFSKAFHASPDAINLNRLADGVYLAINRGFTLLTGYAEEEVVGRSSIEISIWADPADRVRLVQGLRDAGAVDNLSARFRLKDGRINPGRMSARIIEVQGEPCILSITRDVSSEVAAEEALRKSEEQLRTTIEFAADGITFTDERGVVLGVNRRGLEMLGAPAENVIGRRAADLISPESLAQHPFRFDRLDRGEIVVSEREFLRPDGSRLPLEMSSRRMPDGTYQSVLRDLTERKRAEQERLELQRRLDHAARVESIGRLAAGIAHDFNNLLTPIMAAACLAIDDGRVPADVKAGLQTVLDAAGRAADLTRQILALGRRQVLRLGSVDVNAVVVEAQKMLRRVIGEDVRIEIALGAGNPAAMADAGQVHQVVLNLALNARDAMPRGGVLRIATSLLEADDAVAAQVSGLKPGRYVRVDVADTGMGMDESTLSHIFDPFFTTKELGRGTGLGLATARGIAEQHGGWLWATSAVGRGSVFSVCFPAAQNAGEAVWSAESAPRRARGTETVLLVEDEPLVLAAALRILEGDGYSVIPATSAEEALRLSSELPKAPGVLVSDVVMPGLAGHELHARLVERIPGLKVLYLSGYPDDVLTPRGLVPPEVQILPKPFSAAALSAALRAVLD